MPKVVVNNCYGGYSLSKEAVQRYCELKGYNLIIDDSKKEIGWPYYYLDSISDTTYFNEYDIPRDCETLVKVVDELGEKANGECAELRIAEVPDDIDWYIHEYDGIESIYESHRRSW
jgi:hypothetical protein